VQPGQLPQPLSAAIINLNKGQVSAPIQMQQGWYLIKVEDKRSSKPPTFEQAEKAVRAGLMQKKQFEFLSQLAKDSKIVVQ
jgi:peptidyl-prolyl cis-trans isomerase C